MDQPGRPRLSLLRIAVLVAVLAPASPVLLAQAGAASGHPSAQLPETAARGGPALLVELDPGLARTAAPVLRRAGATLVEDDLQIWRLASSDRSVLAHLVRGRVVRRIEPDRQLRSLTAGAGTSVRPESEWWLRKIGAIGLSPPGPGKPVTVIDTGLDVGHPEFAGRANTTPLNAQTGTDEPGGFHGTAVTSLIAGQGAGVIGIYPQVVLREWDASSGGELSLSRIIAGVNAAVRAGPSVINLSLGGPIDDPMLRDAILDAIHRGSFVVAAQGEDRFDGSPPAFPADEPHVLAVVATDRQDGVYIDSNGSEANDLSAPGVGVRVAVPTSNAVSGYKDVIGNSFAAPLVSGAAAWIWTRRPTLNPSQLYQLLVGTARQLGSGGFSTVSGYGLLNLRAAVEAPAPPTDPFEPNDDIDLVRPGGLFGDGSPLLTPGVRHSASIRGSLANPKDRRDVFRASIPPHASLTATVLPGPGQTALRLWRAATRSVLEGAAARHDDLLATNDNTGTERTQLSNATAHPILVYVEVSIGASQRADYVLRLETRPT